MKKIKQIKDGVKEELMLFMFKHGSFDLERMKKVNQEYERAYWKLETQLIIWVALVSINLMSLIYIKTFIQVSWLVTLVVGIILTWVMKKLLDKFTKIVEVRKFGK